jgi:hypothetical protein
MLCFWFEQSIDRRPALKSPGGLRKIKPLPAKKGGFVRR